MQRVLLSCLLIFCLVPHALSFGGTIDLGTLTPEQGLSLQSAAMGAGLGSSVASCDFNGDGKKDAIIGAPNAYSGSGAVIIIYGGSDFSAVDLSDPAASGSGMILTASGKTGFGTKVDCLGNADANTATEDILVGEGLKTKFWAVFGQSGLSSNQELSSLLKCEIYSGGSDTLHDAVAVGDVTGDGKGEVVISAQDGSGYRGVLIMDLSSASVDISSSVQSSRVFITNTGQAAPMTFAPAGNFNGDTYKDFVVGNLQGTVANAAAVIFGTNGVGSPYPTTLDLTILSLGTTPGAVFFTADSTYQVGFSVGYAGDVDADNFDDILVGAPGYMSDRGTVFIVRGSSTRSANVFLPLIPTNGEGYYLQHETLTGLKLGMTVFGGLKSGSSPFFAICDASTNCYFRFVGTNFNYLDSMKSQDGFKIYNSGSSATNPMQIALIGDVNSDGYADYLIGQGSIATVFFLYGPNKCTSPCKTCSGLAAASWTSCTGCGSGVGTDLWYNNNCYGSCPSHSYADSSTTCASCHANCLECTGSTASECSSCDTSGSLPWFYNNACYASCPSHSYADSATTCASCHANCLECAGSTANDCSSYDAGGSLPLFYSFTCYAVGSCPSGTYQGSGTTCNDCDVNCLECSGSATSCTSCDNAGSYPLFYNSYCYGACPSHSYQDSGSTCTTCDSSCLDCAGSATTCTSCDKAGSFPLFYNSACYSSCPSAAPYIYSDTCYSRCPSNMVADSNNVCLSEVSQAVNIKLNR